MFDFVNKAINKILGNKYDKDVKDVMPLVEKINKEYANLQNISHDELRGKTDIFRARVNDHLSEVNQQIDTIRNTIKSDPNMDPEEKYRKYTEIDKLEKERDGQLEEVLMDILPQAFAVVRETARRFTNNSEMRVRATQLDRDLSLKLEYLTIEGDTAIYPNSWLAAGNMISWNMVHYDVQLIGGIVLHQGKIAEMQTGEGKTLVATLPAYLNGLTGFGVNLITVNTYLAQRDQEWMGTIFNFLGLTVDCIDKYKPNSKERRDAYAADITYGTNNEFGFDYLRDNMTRFPEEMVQGKHHFAMIDEVDSVLVDDARTPLIISGPVERGDEHEFDMLKPRVEKLLSAQKKLTQNFLVEAKSAIAGGDVSAEGGGLALLRAYRGFPKSRPLIKFLSEPGMKAAMHKVENHYMAEQNKHMHICDDELYFTIDEKQNTIDLTEKGLNLITGSGDDPDFFIIPDLSIAIGDINESGMSTEEKVAAKDKLYQDYSVKADRIHSVQQLLKAYSLFEKEVDYIIDDGKVKIVDEQTGRVLDGRRYSHGLHQAIESKENVKVEAATQTYATITLQNYFRMFHKLAGMTGTAETEAGEFWEIYKLDCVVIPTNRPVIRKDEEDLVYRTVKEKFQAVINEVDRLRTQGRPVLVGTTTVEVSELLSRLMQMQKIPHNVLNAKQHQREAEIVAEAGLPGAVTIATNMAGRGTDIKLGDGVKDAGGLAIIGTERHDSRRVDRQLRGRAGRQGDPGSSQFFVSLEDKLMRLFGSERIAGVMDKIGYKEGEVIQHSMITKSIERAQKKVEENNFGMRKRLLDYDDVMNAQREVIYRRRKHALFGERLSVDLNNAFYDLAEELVEIHKGMDSHEDFVADVIRYFAIQTSIDDHDLVSKPTAELSERLFNEAMEYYDRKMKSIRDMTRVGLADELEKRGETVKRLIIGFTDGKKRVGVGFDLRKAVDSDGASLVKALEKHIALAFIDDKWKDHLRKMDELKQSVQLAVHEQKDPLLIYKFEGYEMFKGLIGEINRELVSYLFRAKVYVPERTPEQQQIQQMQEDRQKRQTDMSKMEANRSESATQQVQRARQASAQQPAQRPSPVRVGPKVGRNDKCPCGSGKKFKKCHGQNA